MQTYQLTMKIALFFLISICNQNYSIIGSNQWAQVKPETGIKDRFFYRHKLGDYLTVALQLPMMVSLIIKDKNSERIHLKILG